MFISCQLYKSSFIDFTGGGSKGGRYPPLGKRVKFEPALSKNSYP